MPSERLYAPSQHEIGVGLPVSPWDRRPSRLDLLLNNLHRHLRRIAETELRQFKDDGRLSRARAAGDNKQVGVPEAQIYRSAYVSPAVNWNEFLRKPGGG